MCDLSIHQEKVFGWLVKADLNVQIAGDGRAAQLSAARALVRKGLARTWRTGFYCISPEGRAYAKSINHPMLMQSDADSPTTRDG